MSQCLRPLGARQDRQSAIRLLQRRRLRKLGEHLGHLEPDHAARRRGAAPRGVHRARSSRICWSARIGSRTRPRCSTAFLPARFPGEGRTLWTVVNRNEYDVAGEQMRVPHAAGTRYYDVWNGVEMKPRMASGDAMLSFAMEAHGFGAILAVMPGGSQSTRQTMLAQTRAVGARAVGQPLQRVDIPAAADGRDRAHQARCLGAPAGMVRSPGRPSSTSRSPASRSKGDNWIGVDVQYPWEDAPRRGHHHCMHIKSFYIDRYPVTNAEFKKFLDATHYHPPDDHNFLRDWRNGAYPEGWANKPVTWVSLEDARAYAAWAGKRLPHEWEWQYAAQGTDGTLVSLGQRLGRRAPCPRLIKRPGSGAGPPMWMRIPPAPARSASMDMAGNVWQWTDEFVDDHTRAAILRGGSYYQPQGSMWYFPQAYKLTEHGKYLLMAPSKDRAGTLGFRCAIDAAP